MPTCAQSECLALTYQRLPGSSPTRSVPSPGRGRRRQRRHPLGQLGCGSPPRSPCRPGSSRARRTVCPRGPTTGGAVLGSTADLPAPPPPRWQMTESTPPHARPDRRPEQRAGELAGHGPPPEPPHRPYSTTPSRSVRPGGLGGLLLILAGLAAAISLLLDWLGGRRQVGSSLVRDAFERRRRGLRQRPLAAAGDRPRRRRVRLWAADVAADDRTASGLLALLVSLACGRGPGAAGPRRLGPRLLRPRLLVRHRRRRPRPARQPQGPAHRPEGDARVGSSGPHSASTSPAPLRPRARSDPPPPLARPPSAVTSATRAPWARANWTACTRSSRTPVSSNARQLTSSIDAPRRSAPRSLVDLQPRAVEVGAGSGRPSRRSASVRSASRNR